MMTDTLPWNKTQQSEIVDDLSFLIAEPADEYHAQAGEFLSSHQLAEFRRSPLLYYRKRTGLIGDQDRPAFRIGRATHTLILEGRARFNEEFAVGGPINPKTNQVYGANTKAFAEWAAEQGSPVITREQLQLLLQMHAAVAAQQTAADLLSAGIAEAVVRSPYCGAPCQTRMDWFRPDRGIVDLKTCDDLRWFESDARRYGYTHQLAFYRAVLAQELGRNVDVHLIAVEKKEPFRCGVWRLSTDVLDIARQENEEAIDRLLECRQTNHWPTGYEDVRVFEAI